MANGIIYHNISSKTGKELKRVLNVGGGIEIGDSRFNKLIRWGNSNAIRYQAGSVLNKKDALNLCADKQRALQVMTSAGVRVPPVANRFDGEILIGRTANHTQGKGLFVIASQRDFDLAKNNLHCTHFMSYIPTEREYRVHVFQGAVIATAEKRMSDHATSLHVRNYETGWVFKYLESCPTDISNTAISATRSLGIDFGAVDVIKSINGNIYVLEINTAPSLIKEGTDEDDNTTVEHGPAFDIYVRKFQQWFNDSV